MKKMKSKDSYLRSTSNNEKQLKQNNLGASVKYF